jgi:hypothetical protein
MYKYRLILFLKEQQQDIKKLSHQLCICKKVIVSWQSIEVSHTLSLFTCVLICYKFCTKKVALHRMFVQGQ